MPELRRDPVVERWVVIAPERSNRPRDDAGGDAILRGDPALCPFCPGNESRTTREVHADRPAGSVADDPAWTLRVVTNKFPALVAGGDPEPRSEGMHERMDAVGAHEVVIEGRDHAAEWSELPPDAAERTLFAFRARMRAHAADPRVLHVQAFKNHGPSAGASLEHGHAQLIATPIVPMTVREEIAGAERHWRRSGACVYCELVEGERRDGRRVVLDAEGFLAVAAYAPRVPFETWVLPAEHRDSFEECDDASLRSFARVLRETVARMRRALGRPDYNYLLHSAPCRERGLRHYHWHVEIFPRPRTEPAGRFEWGTGIHIVTTPPEEAARTLREARL
jgi:UDPglucose--hexose-1-phosphate uridylyltransferase